VDEAQDLNDCMLSVVMSREGRLALIGDPYQQIYEFNGAVDAISKADRMGFAHYHLTRSFRCPAFAAELANGYLRLMDAPKDFVGLQEPRSGLKGKPILISRTNAALFDFAAQNVEEYRMFFNGGFAGYDFEILLDIVNLAKGRETRHPFVRRFGSLAELEEYVDSVNDRQAATRIKIARKYGNSIYPVYRMIKDSQAKTRESSDLVVTTAHKAKGQESPEVTLTDDFATLKQASSSLVRALAMPAEAGRLGGRPPVSMEEFRLLYVAITRTLRDLHMPMEYVPDPALVNEYKVLLQALPRR
jgi:superfamily I DNA/RNA helicase